MRRRAFIAGAVVCPGAALAAPAAEAWARWRAHDPASTRRVDHGVWSGLLARYRAAGADGIARFDYASLAADGPGRATLAAYLAALAATPVSTLARAEQMAFWINLYNALTVDVVVRHWPVDSIRDIRISPGWFAVGPWGRKLIAVEGEEVSLDDIEHRILRPLWNDPRVHYAVNCASLGCPDLAAEAYAGAALDAQLDRAAIGFVNHPRGARIADGRLRVSSIYEWFKADFGGDDTGVIAHLRRYAGPDLARALAGVTRIAGYGYDWSINRVPAPAL